MSNNKQQALVEKILAGKNTNPSNTTASAWASTNIALCKYWGKRDDDLNLPQTDSLSVTLPELGVEGTINILQNQTAIFVNNTPLPTDSHTYKQLHSFLNLFPIPQKKNWQLNLNFNIPVAAGFASSACCYAVIVKLIDKIFDWNLPQKSKSILARLGSGSACRSIANGFFHWHAGDLDTGEDSFASPIEKDWPELVIALCPISTDKKATSSRSGMQITRQTSTLYQSWPQQVTNDLPIMLQAINNNDFNTLGARAEQNALAMHATMHSAWPPLVYSLPETLTLQRKIWEWRKQGKEIYFTQDAGPNLKLITQTKDLEWLKSELPNLVISHPFQTRDPK